MSLRAVRIGVRLGIGFGLLSLMLIVALAAANLLSEMGCEELM